MFKKIERTQLPKADIITIAVSPEWTPRSLWSEVEDLCTQLRIEPEIIKSIKRKAVKKWKAGAAGGVTDKELDFEFPYVARIM